MRSGAPALHPGFADPGRGAGAGCCSALRSAEGSGRDGAGPNTRVRSRTSWRTVRTNLSANALAFGARTGVLITRAPSDLNTSSKAAVNFVSRSRIRNPTCSSAPSMERFVACWATN